MKKILFVCMGNICRSPAGEGILQTMLSEASMEASAIIDSAGTHGYHSGAKADARMIEHAGKRGYPLLSRSRQFELRDFKEFDLILVADQDNLKNIQNLDSQSKYSSKIKMITDYCTKHPKGSDVPDPYYGRGQGFDKVIDIVEDACHGILEELKKQ